MAGWIKVDAGLHAHPKVLAAGLEGVGLYVLALSYCGDFLTDGFVPAEWLRRNSTPRARARVLEAGLWREVVAGELLEHPDGGLARAPADGVYVPDYLEWNRSKAEVRATSRTFSEAGRRGAAKRWGSSS